MNIEDVFKGEWKSTDEYLIRCPYCGDHKTHNHCFVNPVVGRFMCHFCGESGTLDRLLKDHGDGVEIERSPGTFEKKKFNEIDWSQFKLVTGIDSTMDRLALKYLNSRGVTRDMICEYDIRFSDYGRYYGRVLIPICETNLNGDVEVVSFMARSFIDKVKPKYLYPHHGETKLTTSECVFNWDWFKDSKNISKNMCSMTCIPVIVEGGFDAIAVSEVAGYGGLSILSKQMSVAQLNKLLRLADRTFYVLLDGDARKEAVKIAKTLSSYGRTVYIGDLPVSKDPASLETRDLECYLSIAEKFDFKHELDFKLMLSSKW